MNSRSKTGGRRGFTLIELLVVICIVAILAGLSVAGIQQARTYSEKAACSSNLRQIGSGLLAYASEHDGTMPFSGTAIPHGQVDVAPPAGSGQPGWTEQIEPYMGGVGLAVYRCPSSARLFSSNKIYSYFHGCHPAAAAISEDVFPKFGPVRLAMISNPSITIMGGDIAADMFAQDDADKDDYSQNPAFPGGTIRIHGGASNILFYDGHVDAFKAFDNKTMAVQYGGPTDSDSIYK